MRVETVSKGWNHENDAPVVWVDVCAPAKVNLFLELVGKRSDGFHELETVMSTVSLYDQLRFFPRPDNQIRLTIANQDSDLMSIEMIPTDERNLVVRALQLLRIRAEECCQTPSKFQQRDYGCNVLLWKRIPSQAGLGGASSNAAAALRAGCKLWNLEFSPQKLHEMAAELGSDVPFFLSGGAAVCRGRGELIQPISSIAGLPLVIAKPPVGLSTEQVFGNVQIPDSRREAASSIQSVIKGRPVEIANSLFNRLQKCSQQMTSEIRRMSEAFAQVKSLGHQMSGSGTSYFGVFPTHRVARQAAQALSARLPDVRFFYSQTLSQPWNTAA